MGAVGGAVVLSLVISYVIVTRLEAACVLPNEPYFATTIILPSAIGVACVLVPTALAALIKR